MACMEHVCVHPGCTWCAIDNSRFTSCPEHPGESRHYFDEPMEDDDPPDWLTEEDEYEEDECQS